MVEGALEAFKALGAFLASDGLVDERVKLLLLPAMAVGADLEKLAALLVASDKGAALPMLAQVDFVGEEVRSAAEVLEVVGVNALRLVVLVVEGTPLSFEKVDVEVEVGFGGEAVHQPHFDVLD